MRLAQERVLPKGHTLPGQDRTRFARFVGQTGRPWLSRKFPSSVAGTASPRMQLLGHPFPSLHPTLGACTGAFTRTPQSPGQASREGGAHLCSRSPHLCLPGWWTPGFCHTWHSGSRTCARTAGQEQSLVTPQGQGSQALVPARLPALFLIQRGWQRALNGIKAFSWKALTSQSHREDTKRKHQVWSLLLC